eukprot:PhM_4_TR12393/c0_g1_i2/m.57338
MGCGASSTNYINNNNNSTNNKSRQHQYESRRPVLVRSSSSSSSTSSACDGTTTTTSSSSLSSPGACAQRYLLENHPECATSRSHNAAAALRDDDWLLASPRIRCAAIAAALHKQQKNNIKSRRKSSCYNNNNNNNTPRSRSASVSSSHRHSSTPTTLLGRLSLSSAAAPSNKKNRNKSTPTFPNGRPVVIVYERANGSNASPRPFVPGMAPYVANSNVPNTASSPLSSPTDSRANAIHLQTVLHRRTALFLWLDGKHDVVLPTVSPPLRRHVAGDHVPTSKTVEEEVSMIPAWLNKHSVDYGDLVAMSSSGYYSLRWARATATTTAVDAQVSPLTQKLLDENAGLILSLEMAAPLSMDAVSRHQSILERAVGPSSPLLHKRQQRASVVAFKN